MEEQAFLAAIVAAPDDDDARLIYADWLEERGDVRGEFIRVQCERARTDDRDPRCIDLEYRERSLLAQHRNAWAKPVRKWSRTVEYRRGMVERAALPAKRFVEHGDALLAATPIRHVKLTRVKDQIGAVAQCPHAAHLASLSLRDGRLGLARLRTFLQSPWLGRLEGLDLSFNGLSTSAIRELVAADGLGLLKTLALEGCDLGGEGLEVLLASDLLRGVRELQLGSNRLGDEDVQRLAECSTLGSLRTLSLEYNREIGAEGLRALLASPRIGPLRRLSLRSCGLGEAAEAFAAVRDCHDLVALDLDHNLLDLERPEQAQNLARSSCLTGLVELRLELNHVTDAALALLLETGKMDHLRMLRLPFNRLTAAGVEMLAAWEGAPRLTSLDLSFNAIGNRGAAALARAESLRNLNHLDLRHADISNQGARALARSPSLHRLTTLRLSTESRIAPREDTPKLSADVKQLLMKRFGKHVCQFD